MSAILMTEYLAYSIQYRRLLMRFPLGPGPYRARLLDAMAWLLVDLHRSGVFWGDCSLANTLFRRDGDRIQAFLVDAETSEIHPRALGRPAVLRPRHPRGERRVRARRSRGDAGPRGRLRRRDRRGRDGPVDLRGRVVRAGRTSRSSRPTTAMPSAPGSAASTTSGSPWTRSRWSRAGRTRARSGSACPSRIGGSTRANCSA